MPAHIQATTNGGGRFETILSRGVQQEGTNALGMAVAYVSTYGFNYVDQIVSRRRLKQIKLVANISDCVTHPNALDFALDRGWNVRLVDAEFTFHPKLYIGCNHFDKSGSAVGPSFVIISSANLSYGGLSKNAECTYVQTGEPLLTARPAWTTLWAMGVNATKASITDYQKRFAERNRRRPAEDLLAFGIADRLPAKTDGLPDRKASPPEDKGRASSESVASIAWAGLQSFTGDYTLQVEFPQKAALVLRRLLLPSTSAGSTDMLCSDGERRKFKFRYYAHNGMFRLNIPNDVPNVDWARAAKSGIAFVDAHRSADVYFEILKPGRELEGVLDHSLALGTWGRTTTRLYGWY